MSKECIQVFARVRPCGDPANDFNGVAIDELDGHSLRFNLPPGVSSGVPATHHFNFSGIFWKDSEQTQIFDVVGRPLLEHALNGYNATLFAYGQTGSGKTFTIIGDGTRENAGIVPRAIEVVYEKKKQPDYQNLEIQISYLEIYNNVAYDLLTASPNKQMNKLEDLTKVTFVEKGNKTLFKDLLTEKSPTFESAHKLFWLGETARQKAATVNNKYSSRSHTIFTFHFTLETDTRKLKSQINFVDLAGSEKFGSLEGEVDQRKREARAINMSLHNLQQVIIGLNEKRSHIPFRDSVLTRFLKDSLIGNVKTSMIATISTNKNHIPESISTCRFGESVAEIQTKTSINEMEMSPKEVIERLRSEVARLREELASVRFGGSTSSDNLSAPTSLLSSRGRLSADESKELKERVDAYLNDDKQTLELSNMRQANFCLDYMKEIIKKNYSSSLQVSALAQKLKDSELKVTRLVNMMKERQKSRDAGESGISREAAFIQFRNTHEKYQEELSIHEQLKDVLKQAEALGDRAKQLRTQMDLLHNEISNLEEEDEEVSSELNNAEGIETNELQAKLERVQNLAVDKEVELEEITSEFNETVEKIGKSKELVAKLQKDIKQVREIVQNDFKEFWEKTILGYTNKEEPGTPSTPRKIPHAKYNSLRPLTPSK
ncbi:Kinesin motor domain containing protein [Trichomonas vaginalis G3]|uniref:Kinesin-like protein n=1 Tax=Trichomonas vaginalis (strain ATCC PRA-98 / G3) TaxID=412133 RepID=A2E209_TRIV3|nr:microtubule motor protein [Trichomonas vaginalis G3]EAY13358.1 Kinesin motor domain containing protein [Trichomonas vaginalis G3]KAI5540372.1 microtubule motor protein [Trichomonas vaginalis G3]|eukprot:XP_001325581.1 Kinesin motor domain containing protein [Trichomonas vaginalis G3]